MRRAKFVELTSAYLDGEISEQEKKLLIEEIGRDPERRALFASYKHLNTLTARAVFPKDTARERRKGAICSCMVWCVTGACAGLVVALALLRLTARADTVATQDCAVGTALAENAKPFESQGNSLAVLQTSDLSDAVESVEDSLRADTIVLSNVPSATLNSTAFVLASRFQSLTSDLAIRSR